MSTVRTSSGRNFGQAPLTAVALFAARAERAGIAASGAWVRKTKLLLTQRGHGRIYKRTKKGGTHQASAPGEVPARDDGNLVRSIGFERVGTLTWRWGSGSVVALWMEKGTRRVKPRPWMQRSLSAAGPAIRVAVREALKP